MNSMVIDHIKSRKWGKGEMTAKKCLAFSIAFILVLNIIFASAPFTGFAVNSTASSFAELVNIINSGQNTIIITKDIAVTSTIEVQPHRDVALRSSGNVTLSRANGFAGEIFLVSGSKLDIGSGITLDGGSGNSPALVADSPLVTVKSYSGSGVVQPLSGELVLSGATLKNNNNRSLASRGGAICVLENAALLINSGTISDNMSYDCGGGIALLGGSLQMHDGEITGNSAVIGCGGGVYSKGADVIVRGGKIRDNEAVNGGGMYILDGASTSLSSSGSGENTVQTIITNNKANVGAGVYYTNSLANKPYTISGAVTINNNTILVDGDSTKAPRSLPISGTENECNVFIPKANDAPVLTGLSTADPKASIGLYPLIAGTTVTCGASYASDVLFADYSGITAQYNSSNNYTFSSSEVTITGTSQNGTITTEMGDTITAGKVDSGFPVLLSVSTNTGYTYDKMQITDSAGLNPDDLCTDSKCWYRFDGTQRVAASFTSGTPVAKYGGVNYATLGEALAACRGNSESVITILSDFALSSNNTISDCEQVTIKPDGTTAKTINRGSSLTDDPLFSIGSYGKLVLENIKLSGGGWGNVSEPLVKAYNGELALKTGAILMNNYNLDGHSGGNGGGVYMENGSVLTLDGGVISGNKAVKGGGVCAVNSSIVGDSKDETVDIKANYFTSLGGGVYLDGGSVSGCNISQNTPESGATDTKGGGVYIVKGLIENCGIGITANAGANSNTASEGGGVYAKNCDFSDVTIRNNAAAVGGGVYYDNSVTIDGRAKITGNYVTGSTTNLSNLRVNNTTAQEPSVVIKGALDETSAIGFFIDNTLSVNGAAALSSAGSDYDSWFRAVDNLPYLSLDNSTAMVLTENNGKYILQNSSDCVAVRVVVDGESQPIKNTSPKAGKTLHFDKDEVLKLNVLNYPNMDVSVAAPAQLTVSEGAKYDYGIEESEGDNYRYNVYDLSEFEIGVASGATITAGSVYDITVSVIAAYKPRSLECSIMYDDGDVETYYASNDDYDEIYDINTHFSLDAPLVHPAAVLSGSYVVKTSSEGMTVSEKIPSAYKTACKGYFKLQPEINAAGFGGANALGNKAEMESANISVDMKNIAECGETVKLLTWNGSDTAATVKDVTVSRGGMAVFSVKRGASDVFYIAFPDLTEDEARLDSDKKKYQHLSEAVAASDAEDTITLLNDVTLYSAIVIPDGKNITIESQNGAQIKRGYGYNGALFLITDASELTLKNVTIDGGAEFVNGDANEINNGKLANAAAIANNGVLSMTGCAITNCDVLESEQYQHLGGAISNNGEATLAKTKISGCRASSGGAIYNAGALKLTGGSIDNCVAQQDGGAICSLETGDLEMIDCGVVGNSSRTTSGAGGISNLGTMTIGGNVNITGNNSGDNVVSNVHNKSGNAIVINPALDASSQVGISYPSESGDIIAIGDGRTITDASAYASNFFPDIVDLAIVGKSKQVVLDSRDTDYVLVNSDCGTNGTIYPRGVFRAKKGSDVTFIITPDYAGGYVINDLLVDSASKLANVDITEASQIGEFVLADVNGTKTIYVFASFKDKPVFSVDAKSFIDATESTSGGTIEPATVSVNKTEDAVFTIKTLSGYYLSSLKLGSTEIVSSAVTNSDGTITCKVNGSQLSDKTTLLQAYFAPIYSTRTFALDTSNGLVSLKGNAIHHLANLKVTKIDANTKTYGAYYLQMKDKLTAGSNEYIQSAYDISLVGDGAMYNSASNKFEITFLVGTSYKGQSAKVLHWVSDKKVEVAGTDTVEDDGTITISNITSLSPYAVVLTQAAAGTGGGTGGGGTGGGGTGGGTGGTVDDGKGQVQSGDDPINPVPIAIALTLMLVSACAITFVVKKHYFPRLRAWYRGKLSSISRK